MKAKWERTGKVIYSGEPKGNLVGRLPLGSWLRVGLEGTLIREDGGDPFESARFYLQGEPILITRDPGVAR